MALEIRRFDPADRQAIIDLSLRAWAPVFAKMEPAVLPYVYAAFYPDGWQKRQEADVAALLESDAENIRVAAQGAAAIGWVGIRLHAEDSMGEIHILAVHPEHQRRGVAAALMDHAFTEMKAAGMAIAMVETGGDPGHEASRATYEAAGFERWPVARYFREL